MKVMETEAKRPVGRPATFPGVETAMLTSNIPLETKQDIAALAARRVENINLTVDKALRAYLANANRPRGKTKAAATAN